MKLILTISFLLGYISCTTPQRKLVQTGEANFRISLNYLKDLSETELDSIEKTKPKYSQIDITNRLYQSLLNRGFVQNRELDTAGLHLRLITWENPVIDFGKTQIILDTTEGNDHIIVKEGSSEVRTTLGEKLLGDIFVSYTDLDKKQGLELLVLKKYYVMNGYNFDMKAFALR